MRVSELWLREMINPLITRQELLSQLTMAGLEIESCAPVAGEFTHVIVALVKHTTPHPKADKLTLCEVDSGNGQLLQIVCGAPNVCAGLKVALALPGATLPGDICIQESNLRGCLSQGMLCSSAELGIEDRTEGIIELPVDAPIGMNLRDYMQLDDYILDIDITPNRGDCMSMLGVAREVSAINQIPMQNTQYSEIPNSIDQELTINLHAPAACANYLGRIIRGIDPNAISPLWLKEKLRRAGIRLLHPVVDVLNYVMIELGQPMHAFDLQKIQGDIHIRFGNPAEQLVLLDGRTITLNEDILVIADNEKAIAMAGVMGGLESSVQNETVDIFIESAWFNPLAIGSVARKHGLISESSQRYERGVDWRIQSSALNRATELLLNIVGGSPGPVSCRTETKKLILEKQVRFRPERVKKLAGFEIAEQEIARILLSLGMSIDYVTSTEWLINSPSWRFDISLEEDLIEEVVRIYGYDNIPLCTSLLDMKFGKNDLDNQFSYRMANFLVARGYMETISYSFVDPQLQQVLYPNENSVTLLNPISTELSQMRVGMWPGLIASMLHNIHRQHTAIKFFEIGVSFRKINNQVEEQSCIAGLVTGITGDLNWSETTKIFDFYDLKGDLEAFFNAEKLSSSVEFLADKHDTLHPGQSAKILIDGQIAGWIGALHPLILDNLDLSHDVLLFELYVPKLLRDENTSYRALSKYPQTRRDLSLLVDIHVTADQIEQIVRDLIPNQQLKSFDVFDYYLGESIPSGKKGLSIALTLQDGCRTLIDTEVDLIIESILKSLYDQLAITLRD